MNWDAIGAIGEIVGATAVCVSLIYLAIQIRGQNKQSRTASIREFANNFNHINGRLATSSELSTLWNKAMIEGFEGLSDGDAVRFSALLQELARNWESAYYHFEVKTLDKRLWNSIESQLSEIASSKAFKQFWAKRAHYFSVDFRNYIDTLKPGEYQLISKLVKDDS